MDEAVEERRCICEADGLAPEVVVIAVEHTRLMRRARETDVAFRAIQERDRLAQRLVELEAENRRAWAMVRKLGDSDG